MGIGQIIGGPVGAPLYGARNIGQIGGSPAIRGNQPPGVSIGLPVERNQLQNYEPTQATRNNPNIGIGFGPAPIQQNPNVSKGFGPAPIQQNPNVGIGFGMPPQTGGLPVQIGMDQVAGPVAPSQQATSQYQPYFQQMRQGVNNLTQTLQQMENLPGQQYSGSNQNLNYFASKGAGGGI